jgi:uncharacterized protein (UPF0332 family)
VSSDPGLDRARTELQAARLLAEHGFAAQAVSRAYFAAFYAAEAALERVGEVRSKHAGVVAAFARLIVGQNHVPEDAGRLLRSLFERRSHADYDVGETPPEEAARALTDAGTVVDAVAAWLEHDSDHP